MKIEGIKISKEITVAELFLLKDHYNHSSLRTDDMEELGRHLAFNERILKAINIKIDDYCIENLV